MPIPVNPQFLVSKKLPPNPFDPVAFGERIRQRRTALGLLQVALATRAGLQVSALSPYENGLRLPSDPAILVSLARALEVSVDWLLTGRTAPMTPEEQADYERGWMDALRGVQRYLSAEMERPVHPTMTGQPNVPLVETGPLTEANRPGIKRHTKRRGTA